MPMCITLGFTSSRTLPEGRQKIHYHSKPNDAGTDAANRFSNRFSSYSDCSHRKLGKPRSQTVRIRPLLVKNKEKGKKLQGTTDFLTSSGTNPTHTPIIHGGRSWTCSSASRSIGFRRNTVLTSLWSASRPFYLIAIVRSWHSCASFPG
jgi:hypothetical protein